MTRFLALLTTDERQILYRSLALMAPCFCWLWYRFPSIMFVITLVACALFGLVMAFGVLYSGWLRMQGYNLDDIDPDAAPDSNEPTDVWPLA